MSKVNEWMLTHSDRFADEELLAIGYNQEDIALFRSECPREEKEESV